MLLGVLAQKRERGLQSTVVPPEEEEGEERGDSSDARA